MNLFGLMETSGSAMQAERIRAEVVAANMANAETTRTAQGGPYRRKEVVFAANRPDSGFLDSGSLESGNIGSGFLDPGSSGPEFSGPGFIDSMAAAGAPPFPAGGFDGSQPVSTGVHVAQVIEDPSPPLMRYDPGHPDANAQGYVAYPNINPITEMVDLMGATRAYGLNGSAVDAEKEMIGSALDIAKS